MHNARCRLSLLAALWAWACRAHSIRCGACRAPSLDSPLAVVRQTPVGEWSHRAPQLIVRLGLRRDAAASGPAGPGKYITKLPDLRAALDEVSLFIYRADRSRMRKPEAPSAECIEAFCAVQQKKVRRIARDRAVVRGGAGG